MGMTPAEFFRHNTWANRRLLDVCAGLSDDLLDASAPGTYGSIRDTLTHVAAAQGRYLAALRGEQPPDPAYLAGSLGAVRAALLRSSGALEEVAARIPAAEVLRGVRGGQPYAIPAWVFLLQAINHATDHRSQIATILSGQGIMPPDLDSWAYYESLGAVNA